MSNKVCDNMSELVSKDGDSSFLCDVLKKNLEMVGYAVDCCNSEKHPAPEFKKDAQTMIKYGCQFWEFRRNVLILRFIMFLWNNTLNL